MKQWISTYLERLQFKSSKTSIAKTILTSCISKSWIFLRSCFGNAESRRLALLRHTIHGIPTARHMLSILATTARSSTASTTIARFTQEPPLMQPASSQTTSRTLPSTGQEGCTMPKRRKPPDFATSTTSSSLSFSYSFITLESSTLTLTFTMVMASNKPSGPQTVS